MHKEELLDIDYTKAKEIDISFKDFITVVIIMMVIIILFAPKIYIQNNIYYKSNNIQNRLYPDYLALKSENNQLKLQLEKEYFKNQIMNLEFR